MFAYLLAFNTCSETTNMDEIYLIGGNGFCAVAGECELNRGGDLGTEADVFCLLENDWE